MGKQNSSSSLSVAILRRSFLVHQNLIEAYVIIHRSFSVEHLFRYWSHVVNCRSCSAAHKGLKVLEVVLKFVSVSLIGIVAATKQSTTSMAVRTSAVLMAILCFAASKGLAHLIYKHFHFHDYNHGTISCDDGASKIKLPALKL